MLTRRKFLKLSGGSTIIAATGYSPIILAKPINIMDIRAPDSLGVTMGSILGTALQVLVYSTLTRHVPSSVIAVFAGILGAQIISTKMTAATNTYVDYRMDEVDNKLVAANQNIQKAMLRDAEDFRRLSAVVHQQGNYLNQLRNSSETTIRELRSFKKELKDQIHVFREEKHRSNSCSAVHQFSKSALRTGDKKQDMITEKACDQVSHASGELRTYIQSLQESVL